MRWHSSTIKKIINPVKSILGRFYAKAYRQPLHRFVIAIKPVHQKLNTNIYWNIALLYAWIVIFGLFSLDYSSNLFINLWQNIFYLFITRDGILSNLSYLAPLVVILYGCKNGRAVGYLKPLFFLPLINVFFHYRFFINDYFHFWGFWLSAIISFYAAINIAIFTKRPPIKNLPPFLLKIESAIAPLGKQIKILRRAVQKYLKK